MLNFNPHVMKKFLHIILLASIILSSTGCYKDPEVIPLYEFTEDYVFDSEDKTGVLASQFLNNIYTHLPNGFTRIGGNVLDAATDDAMPSRNNNGTIEILRGGRLNSLTSNPDDAWNSNYQGIRKANIFLSKIDIVPVDDQTKTYWKSDARFLRAMFYFEMVKRYGGVPLIGDTVFNGSDKINVKRNTFEQCVNYIVSECDAIKDLTRPEPIAGGDWGRISKGVVLSLKAKVLNYAASPLYNGGNIALTDGNAANDELQGYLNYDVSRWQKAADAAKEVMDLNTYQLVSLNLLFTQRKNAEMIFAYLRTSTRDLMLENGPIGFNDVNTKGQGLTSPTQDLVEAFPMINGNPIATDPLYNPNNPYVNRDPRLARSVFLNGTQWLRRNVETFEGGLDKPNSSGIFQTRTGYYSKKYMNFGFSTSFEYSLQHVNFQIFRYADILLMYAEAMNELSVSPPIEVYDILKQIRIRAGITATNNYGIPSVMTKKVAQEFIQLERRLEFFMEEQRFWDVRRWKLAQTEFNKDLKGVRITKTGTNTYTYENFIAGNIIFDSPRMYMYPLPNTEILRNVNLVQNAGW
jgi:starch-binding outer membrane protein, SusD/RagB family